MTVPSTGANTNTHNNNNNNNSNNNSIPLSVYQQLVAYNRGALKLYITKARLKLELDQNLILSYKIIHVARQ
jgi:hypothetical protein